MHYSIDPPRRKRRAKELYDADSPFKQKVVESKKKHKRKPKHKGQDYE